MRSSAWRTTAAVVLAVAAWWGAWTLNALQDDLEPHRQGIKIRWAAAATDQERVRLERDFSLAEGEARESRTWSYRLGDRSRDNLTRLVSNPLVEDTDGIDRTNFRVLIDAPELPPWLRRLAEADRLPSIALFVALAGFVPLVVWRRHAMDVVAHLITSPEGSLAIDRALPGLVGAAAAAILLAGAPALPEDSAFVHLYEAVSLLAGDRPYRDFFEWGAPLAAYLSAGAQWLSGYRVIGEMALQWAFIVGGVIISVRLGLRLSRSRLATLLIVPAAVLPLAKMPTYHYSKLFCFPLAIWLAWRYLDRPTLRRSGTLGVATALAFLLRHDYGVWVGFASVLALGLAAFGNGQTRPRLLASAVAVYAAAVAITLLPWALVVQWNEGLVSYVQARREKYEPASNPLLQLLHVHPIDELGPERLPPPKRGTVEFVWRADIDEERQRRLEREYGLEPRERDNGRVHYEIANLYDVRLLGLRGLVNDDHGFDWGRLSDVQGRRPSVASANLWMSQMAMLTALVLAVSGGATMWTRWRRSEFVPRDAAHMLLAGAVLVVVDTALFRELSYVMTVAPVTAALSARFLAWRGSRPALAAARSSLAFVLLTLTTYAAWVDVQGVAMFDLTPSQAVARSAGALGALAESPPRPATAIQGYLRDCTVHGDRLLVGGMSPFHINYFAGRPMAGGHLYWHTGWRSDPAREAQSLALLEQQSVPFAVSSSDPVLADFEQRYPRIHQYLTRHYREVPGSDGRLLVDTRRHKVADYGRQGWPCFRAVGPPP